jgi:putative peptide zinc metalloprotease protein
VFKSVFTVCILTLLACFFIFNNQIFHTGIAKSEWFLFFLLSFFGVTFHEFGHASAAHYYGARHGGIGGGFYLFMPVYFADVTDIWKLSKNQRIVVNLAGMYFEMVYAVLLILVGLIINYQILIVLTCIFSIKILNNINPFIRSDGYWILSDAIEKPNMMFHGLSRVKQIFMPKKMWKKMDYFLLVYGLISYSFLIFFLYYIVIKDPNSVLYFPQNIWLFSQNLFLNNGQFSLSDLGDLFIPILFFYLVFNSLKSIILNLIKKLRQSFT